MDSASVRPDSTKLLDMHDGECYCGGRDWIPNPLLDSENSSDLVIRAARARGWEVSRRFTPLHKLTGDFGWVVGKLSKRLDGEDYFDNVGDYHSDILSALYLAEKAEVA